MAGAAVGKVEWRIQPIRPEKTNQHGMGRTRAVGMLYCVLTAALSTEIWSREHKNSSDVDDAENSSLPGYGSASSNAKFLTDFRLQTESRKSGGG